MPDIPVIKEFFVILMILTDGDSVASVNHATANDDLNVFETQKSVKPFSTRVCIIHLS